MSRHASPPFRPSHAPVEYPMPNAAEALFQGLLVVISRLFWNREQEEWDQIQDPGIPGLLWSPYDWHDDTPEAAAPHFVFRDAPAHLHGMEIRWYKHPAEDSPAPRTGITRSGANGMTPVSPTSHTTKQPEAPRPKPIRRRSSTVPATRKASACSLQCTSSPARRSTNGTTY